MATRVCPQCEKYDQSGLPVCSCGHVFTTEGQPAWEIPPYEPIHTGLIANYKINRLLILLGFLLLSTAGILTFFTFLGAETEDADQASESRPASEPQNPKSLIGNSATKNLYEGVVTRVVTGDAIAIRDNDNKEFTVRLFGIAAPKMNDKFGKEAKESLSAEILGKSVRVIAQKIEDSGAIVGRVIRDDLNIGFEQVRKGFAIHNSASEQTPEERKSFVDAEALAKNGKLGLWSIAELPAEMPVNPEIVSTKDTKPFSDTPSLARAEEPERVVVEQRQVKVELPKPLATPQITSAPKPLPSVVAPPPVSRITPAAAETRTETKPVTPGPTSVRQYIRGPRGGCYYLNSKGSKSYVDHSLCQ